MAKNIPSISFPILICSSIYNRFIGNVFNKIINKISKKKTGIPWMCYEEMEIIEWLLKHLKPSTCLEWGTGYSTIYFSRLLSKDNKWTTVEHDKKWAEKIITINKNKNVEIFCVEPNNVLWADVYSEGTYLDFKDYVEFPSNLGPFDFILVDGRARKDCLEKAHQLLSENGIVVLHDAEREHYHSSFPLYKYQCMLGDYVNCDKKLWIGSKKLDVNKLIDINKCKMLWKIYRYFPCILCSCVEMRKNAQMASMIVPNNSGKQ